MLRAQHESHVRACHDSLTGVLNRAGLDEALHARLGKGLDRFTLFCLDLDGFKPVNDLFGHLQGDRLLSDMAERLSESVRVGDLVARIGGDEFVVIAGDLEELADKPFASAMIERISRAHYSLDGTRRVEIGVSVGSARWPADGCAVTEVHRRADAALYAAKAAGRGVHCAFGEQLTGERPQRPGSMAADTAYLVDTVERLRSRPAVATSAAS